MGKIVTVETEDKEEPILLVFGDGYLEEKLIANFIKELRIVHVSDINSEKKPEGKKFYRIAKESSHLVKNLEEKFQYAVIFLKDNSAKKFILEVAEKLTREQTKTLIIVDAFSEEYYYGLISELLPKENFSFAFLGDVYNGSNLESHTSKIIQNAILKKSIELTGNDLTPLYPIFINDAIEGVNQILFSNFKKKKLFYFFYSHPQTLISAIHLIKRVEPDLEIKYSERNEGYDTKPREKFEEELKSNFKTQPEYLDDFFIGFEKSINLINRKDNFQEIEPKEIDKIPDKIGKIKNVPKRFVTNKFIISSILTSLAFYFLIVFSMLFLGFSTFMSGVLAFKNGDLYGSLKIIQDSQALLSIAEPSVVILSKTNIAKGAVENYFAVKEAADLLKSATQNIETFKKMPSGIKDELFRETLGSLYYLYFKTERLKLEHDNKSLSSLTNKDITKLLTLAPVAAEILGFDKDKRYLLLFQNDGELRPTGGFIGSIGEISFSKGKVKEFKIRDVYELDGQLKAHVEPNFVIRRYLQPHLYLRDSNFHPNFETTASFSALLYNLETKQTVDGVIGINFSAIKEIIKEIGPLSLPGFNKTINDENAFGFLQETIEKDFFPGSTQKKDVLNALFNQIVIKLEENPRNYYKLAKVIPGLMSKKNILFAFNTNSVQKIFSLNGFSNNFTDLREKDTTIINDTFSVNEANIGMNKANINVSRKVEYGVSFTEEGEIRSDTKIEIENTGDKDDYTSYIRIIAPQGSTLDAIKIEGQEEKIIPAVVDFKTYESKKFSPPKGLEVDETTENNLKYFGFIVNIPKNSKKTVEASFKNGLKIPNKRIFNYSLLYVKQPGIQDMQFKLNVNYGSDISPQEVKKASFTKNGVAITDTIQGDKIYDMKLIRRN